MKRAANYLFFNFKMNPLHKTFHMNSSTGAWAFARIEKIVCAILSLLKTNFTLTFFFIPNQRRIKLHDLSAGINFLFIPCRRDIEVSVNKDLTDIKLNPSNFNRLPGLQLVSFGFSIDVLDFSYNDVCLLFPGRFTLNRFVGL